MSYTALFRVFGRIGLLSFGGPAAQIALMHKELVEDRDWLTEDQFLRALSFCMLLPGPEAMQLATYAGWRQRGILGGLLAGGLFVIPGAILIAILALLYGAYGGLDWVQSAFLGVQATVIVIVIGALLKVSKRALKSRIEISIAVLAFVALFLLSLPFPLVVIAAAIFGATQQTTVSTQTNAGPTQAQSPWAIIFFGLVIWFLPIGLALANGQTLLTEIGFFFSKLAVVTFGGAYAVLAYMTQDVVSTMGWLSTEQMMDALGLAETTPGPLILVTQFVAMLTGVFNGGTGLAIAAGAMALWVTFVPCFIWIFAGAPLIDWLESQPRLRGALSAITAAVVGVIANLSIWFAMHVFFRDTDVITYGPINTTLPEIGTLQPLPIALAIMAGVLMLVRGWNMLLTLGIMAIASVFLALL